MKTFSFLRTYTFLCAMLLLASSGWGQGSESFTNLPTTSSNSYLSRTWTGDDGVIWTAEGARTDQTIHGKAICWGNSENRNVISPGYVGGMGTLSFDYVRAFTGTSMRSLEVYVNGIKIGETITVSPTSDVVVEYSEIIDVPGNVVLEIRSTGAAQVKLGGIVWTSYTTAASILSTSPIALSEFTYEEGAGPSGSQLFEVSGLNLDRTNVTISAPANFEIAETEAGTYGSSITLPAFDGAENDIWVRLVSDLDADDYSGNVTISGGGADPINVAVSGEVTAPPPPPISISAFDFFYFQDFNTLAQSGTVNLWTDGDIFGWYWQGNSPRDPNVYGYVANPGTSNTAAGHSYGAAGSEERAIGALTGNGHDIVIGVQFKNETGGSIDLSDILICYTGEQWRQTANIQSLVFSYLVSSVLITDITIGTYAPNSNLDFTALHTTETAGALDGNLSENQIQFIGVPLENAVKSVLGPGEYLMLRWHKTGATSPGLAIDDFSLVIGDSGIDEPSNHVADFTAMANSFDEITVTWEHNDGDVPATNYLILAKTGGTVFQTVADGDFVSNDLDWSDNRAAVNVMRVDHETQSYTWTGLTSSTLYDFRIYPYNGEGNVVNYKTDVEIPEASAETQSRPIAYYFRTKQSGSWHSTDTWEQSSDQSVWIDALVTPTYESNNIDIIVGHTVTVDQNLQVDQLSIQGTLVIEGTGVTFTLANGEGLDEAGTDLIVQTGGVLRMAVTGSTGGWAFLSGATWKVADGGTYTHNSTRSAVAPLNNSTLESGSSFKYVGSNSVAPAMALSGRTYYNFFFESSEGSWSNSPTGSNALTINGSLTIAENVGLNFGGFTGNISVGGDFTNSGNAIFGGNVVVDGTLTNNAGVDGLVIKDGGSILHHTNDVAATVELELPFGGWQKIGSPVSGMDIIGSDFAPADNPLPSNFDFYYFNESVADYPWINLRGLGGVPNTADFAQFVPGRGYLVAYFDGSFATNPFSFKGSLNTGTIGMPLNYTAGANEGWNLIANPYPSGIDWGKLNKSALAEHAAQIYNRVTQEYVPQEGGIIAANQGFFVKTGSTGTLSLTNADRANGGPHTKDNDQQERLVISLANDTHNSSTTLRLIDGSCFRHDRRDASKLFSLADHMPQVYTHTSDEVMVAINSIPAIDQEKVITVGVRIPTDGSYTLSASEISGRFQSSPLYLLNNKTGVIHNLKENPEYSFQATKGDEPALFELWFTQPTDVQQLPAEGLTHIYTHGKTLYMAFDQEAPGRIMEVFDISGRRLMHKSLDNGQEHTIQLNIQTGVYIVRVTSREKTETKRIFVE